MPAPASTQVSRISEHKPTAAAGKPRTLGANSKQPTSPSSAPSTNSSRYAAGVVSRSAGRRGVPSTPAGYTQRAQPPPSQAVEETGFPAGGAAPHTGEQCVVLDSA